jgi:hypothetical protein
LEVLAELSSAKMRPRLEASLEYIAKEVERHLNDFIIILPH